MEELNENDVYKYLAIENEILEGPLFLLAAKQCTPGSSRPNPYYGGTQYCNSEGIWT